MSKRDHFFHFELCLLSTVRDVRKGLDDIISYACVEMGEKIWEGFTPDRREVWRSVLAPRINGACGVNLSDDREIKVLAGSDFLGLELVNVKSTLAAHDRLMRFVNEYERRYGCDALVRIRADWLFEVRDNKGMSFPEAAVLAAIYSKIGASRKPVRITREEIWLRAHGFKSGRVFTAEMIEGRTKTFITLRRVRSIVERLHDRKFFSRITYGHRQTFYSHRLNRTALAEQVLKAKLRRDVARRARIAANADLTKRVQAERRKLAANDATDAATDPPL